MDKEIFLKKCKNTKKGEKVYVAFPIRNKLGFYSVEKIRFEGVEGKDNNGKDLYTILIEKTGELICCTCWHLFKTERQAVLQSRILNRQKLKEIQKNQENLGYLF